MRILIADKLSAFVPDDLRALGATVTIDPASKGAALTEHLGKDEPEVLVVRSTPVGAADIAASKELSLVIRAGAGVNTIDLDAASARGVYVANCPGKNAAAVAELAIGHLVNLDRRIADNVIALRERRWDKKGFGVARGLRGRTLAVLGVGQIGRETVARARAFGMRIVAWSRSLDDAQAEALGIERRDSPEEAVSDADAVTVHLALADETRGRIGASVIDAMKKGALFVNTSRAEIVDQDALRRAVEERGVRAGLDVFATEPSAAQGKFEDSIVDLPGVYGTHHIGASTDEAEDAVGHEVVRIVQAYRDGKPIPNCVNLAARTPATHLLVVRHEDEVGVLASVLDVLREAGHNVQEMQNVVFSGARAACARIGIVGAPTLDTMRRIGSNRAIFAVSVVQEA